MHLTESVEYLDKKIALGRARMEDLAAVYGRAHPTVINYSQRLDKLIVQRMRLEQEKEGLVAV